MKFKSTTTAPFLVLCVSILTLLVSYLDTDKLAGKESIYLAWLVIELMVFVVPSVFYCKLKGNGYTETLGLRPFALGRFSLVGFLLLVLLSGVILLKVVLYRTGVLAYAQAGTSVGAEAEGAVNNIYLIFTAAILPAVVEEFLFRGVILSEYSRMGGILSVSVSALFFAMVHFSMEEFPIYFFGGLIMGAAAYLTRSLFSSILIHTAYNLFTLYAEAFIWKLLWEEQSHIFFLYILAVVFLLFLVLSIGEAERIFYGYAVSSRGEFPFVKRETESFWQALAQIPLSVGFLLYVAFFAFIIMTSRG